MCCGSRRSAWRNASAAPGPPSTTSSVRTGVSRRAHTPDTGGNPAATTAATPAQGPFPSVTLHYTGSSAIRVRGPITGQPYDFSGSQPFQAVDVRDAAVLARNDSFRKSPP
jgi:hypothetical protein